MGNKIARTTQVSASEYYLDDLPSSYNLVLKEVLGRGRFLKSIQCKHDQGLVLVKVYFKRGDSIDLRDHQRRLSHLRQLFQTLDHPHVWPFQLWHETDKAAYLIRQYFFNNLHDRLGTRPFLNVVEKKWLAFQLLYAVKQSHENGVCHGDIKCENVLVTSWNWLYLADFASFKPTYIPHDDPSDFSFFFDTGGRRRCYLAPENCNVLLIGFGPETGRREKEANEWVIHPAGYRVFLSVASVGSAQRPSGVLKPAQLMWACFFVSFTAASGRPN